LQRTSFNIQHGNGRIMLRLFKGGNHGSAHVSVLSRTYCFLTNQWRVDFRGKFAFVNRGYAVVTAVIRVIDFFALEKECLRKILPQKVASVTACVPERMEVMRKAVHAKCVAYSAPKDANALRPANIARNRLDFYFRFHFLLQLLPLYSE